MKTTKNRGYQTLEMTDIPDLSIVSKSVDQIDTDMGEVFTQMTDMTNKKLSKMHLGRQLQMKDHLRSIVAICDLTNNIGSTGTLSLHRWNGIDNIITIDVAMQAEYYSNYTKAWCDFLVRSGRYFESIRPCTFTYNGINYGGLEIYGPAQYPDITFYGLTNEQNLPFCLEYYDQQTGTILNQEVYNSINFENIIYGGMLSLNGKNILTYGDTAEWFDLTLTGGYKSIEGFTARYSKSGDTVYVRGGVVHSTGIANHGDEFALLPVEYRPSANEYYSVPLYGAGSAMLVILPNGQMIAYAPDRQDAFNAGMFFTVSFRL